MPFPTSIETAADFERLVQLGQTPESRSLEFKRDLDRWAAQDAEVRRQGQKEFCRDVSQFANAWGGCLLIGIDEGRVGPVRVATAVRGVDDFDGRRAWMEQAMTNFLVPDSFRVPIHPVVIGGQTIISVCVTPSERLVTLWDSQLQMTECVRRTNHGREHLHPDEMELFAMNTRRAAQIMFRRVLDETPAKGGVWHVDLTSGVWTDTQRPAGDPQLLQRVPAEITLGPHTAHHFELRVKPVNEALARLSTPTVRIPYGLLREAWTTSDGRVGLFLHVRVVQRKSEVSLEPF